MSVPSRVQLRRTKGWRMPPNTVKVDRTTKWGNPFKVHATCNCGAGVNEQCRRHYANGRSVWHVATVAEAIERFRQSTGDHEKYWGWARAQLRGKNLGCSCPLDQPCHADVLLEIANDDGHLCCDCELDTIAHGHYYMVSAELWAESGMAPEGGMLCLDCLEGRLGRPLRREDFTAIVPRAWPHRESQR